MADDIGLVNGSFTATFTGTFNYTGPASAHVGANNVPVGGNFLFEDAHVEWIIYTRSYSTIGPTASGVAAGNSYFLYPIKYGKGPW